MERVEILAPAKLNLALDIVGKRKDNYHILETVMQSINVCDTVTLAMASDITIACDRADVPCNKTNIAFKAATCFFAHTSISGGVHIAIDKHIPSMAGMGGGSADGAAVFKGLNRLYNAGLSTRQLAQISVSVGADIPFCIYGNTALVTGIGECVTPIRPLCDSGDYHIVVAMPTVGVSTKEAFAAFDRLHPQFSGHSAALAQAINSGTFSTKLLYNTFEQVVTLPKIAKLKSVMGTKNHPTMTGSGSAVFCIFDALDEASTCLNKISTQLPHITCFLCQPIQSTKDTD